MMKKLLAISALLCLAAAAAPPAGETLDLPDCVAGGCEVNAPFTLMGHNFRAGNFYMIEGMKGGGAPEYAGAARAMADSNGDVQFDGFVSEAGSWSFVAVTSNHNASPGHKVLASSDPVAFN
jgi:hypothetical protein